MRAGEICGVRWEDFDEDDRTLRVVRSVDFVHKELVIGETKTEDGKRTIYLPDSLWRLLSERKKKSFSEWIFPNLLKPGTGYVKQLSANCWQGRYTPTVNEKRIARNVYAPTEEDCEVKLADLIKEMKAEFWIK